MKTEHNLSFEVAEYKHKHPIVQKMFESMPDDGFKWMAFRVGTVDGLWCSGNYGTIPVYAILSVINEKPGNGHFTDVLQWFENSCKRDGKHFMIMEVWNDKFKNHLIEKRGFKAVKNTDHVIKSFSHEKNT